MMSVPQNLAPPAPPLRGPGPIWQHVALALLIAFGARAVSGQGSGMVVMAWMGLFCFVLPILVPRRAFLTIICAVAVFLDQSLWFLQGNVTVNTIYEHPGAPLKPPEFLVLAGLCRLAFRDGALLRNVGSLSSLSWLTFFWGLALFAGLSVALVGGTPFRDIAIYSEVRGPFVFVALTWIFVLYGRGNLPALLISFAALLMVQILISALSWTTGLSLLWVSYAPNYVGSWAAFYGADESVRIAVLGCAVGLALFFGAGKAIHPTAFKREKLFGLILTVMCLLAIVASARRGGFLSVAVLLLVVLVLLDLRNRMKFIAWGTVAVLLALGYLVFNSDSQTILSVQSRLLGQGSVTQSDGGRLLDFLQARDHIREHLIFGSGPGTRLALWRVQFYGKADSLSIHSSILHIWTRLGILGVISLAAPLFIAIGATNAVLKRRRFHKMIVKRAVLSAAMLGFFLGSYAWELFTPPFVTNFRVTFVMAFALAVLLINAEQAKAMRVESPRTDPDDEDLPSHDPSHDLPRGPQHS